MKARLICYISFLIILCPKVCFSQQPEKALVNYISKKDTAFNWVVDHVETNSDGKLLQLTVVSQRWQGDNWGHRLMVYFPKSALHPNTMLIVLRHIYNRNAGLASLKHISDSTGTPSALLYDIPNQPLFNGKEEDDLQAYTFSQYIKTGDESWPLLFPMVKSVVRSMDVVQALALKEAASPVRHFVIAGHSKRGHTAWLAAAVDSRIKGIIPIAIDVLNARKQMPHHLKSFGVYSTPSESATKFLDELRQPRGDRLIDMIDPYSYRKALMLPKLIVCGTNDDYFPTDALNLYWDGLKGNKSILYLSNAGHVRADSDPRINPTAFAFIRAIAEGKILPSLRWQFKHTSDSIELIIDADTSAFKATLWQASSESNDLRASQWHGLPMKQIVKDKARRFVLAIKKPTAGTIVLYGEVEFYSNGHRFLLSGYCL